MRGRTSGVIEGGEGKGLGGGLGLKDGEVKVVFRAMQASYIRLLQNPFYDPDEHSPPSGKGGKKISSKQFADDMRRIGKTWAPGMGIV